jgi:hypothetical protein
VDTWTKDVFQVAAWAVAVLGGLVAAWKAILELRRSNDQRRVDLRWRQAEMAKRCLDELLGNREAHAALKMLDWDGLSYEWSGGTTQPITHEKRRAALRTENTFFPPGDDGPFVRDAYDALFDGLERLEQFVRIELIRFEDVAEALQYYVEKLGRPGEREVVERFLETYGFSFAIAFLARFKEWRTTQPALTD